MNAPQDGIGAGAPPLPVQGIVRQTPQARNPLHGLTLEAVVTALAAHYGWPGLAQRIPVRCFTSDPSVASSLKFLRKTPWARDKVEGLYLFMLREVRREVRREARGQVRSDKGCDVRQNTGHGRAGVELAVAAPAPGVARELNGS